MLSTRLRLAALTSLAWAFAPAAAAHACSCVTRPSGHQPCQARWTSAAVFTGRVLKIESGTWRLPTPAGPFDAQERRVYLEVTEAFAGVPAVPVVVHTGIGGGDCGFDFAQGAEYLIYAYRREDGALSVGICSPPRRVNEAGPDLAYLRAVSSVAPPEGRLLGIVVDSDAPRQGSRTLFAPLPGIRVTAQGSGLSRSATSGTDGRFEIALPPGRYRVTTDAGQSLTSRTSHDVELLDARGCAVADVYVSRRQRGVQIGAAWFGARLTSAAASHERSVTRAAASVRVAGAEPRHTNLNSAVVAPRSAIKPPD